MCSVGGGGHFAKQMFQKASLLASLLFMFCLLLESHVWDICWFSFCSIYIYIYIYVFSLAWFEIKLLWNLTLEWLFLIVCANESSLSCSIRFPWKQIQSMWGRLGTVLFHRFTRRCGLRVGNASCVTDVWNPYRITPIHWLMARRRLWRNHVVSLYWRTRHPLLRFLCLHEVVTLPFVVAIFWPKLTFCDHPFALRRLPQWNFVLFAVKCHGVSSLSTAVRAFHRSRRPTQ